MASLRKKGGVWHYRYIDEAGVQRERRGCPDRRATELMAGKAEADVARLKAGITDRAATESVRPLAEHVAAFRASLEGTGASPKHVRMTLSRVRRVLELAGVRSLPELTLSKALDAMKAIRGVGLGQESINHHVRAVKAFSRWLHRDGRLREHALAHLRTASSEGDRRRERRSLSAEEATRLIAAAGAGPEVLGMTGPDRAMLYRLALATGFRADELASLRAESFRLDARPPAVVCRAAYTKNGREAEQPIPALLAAALRPWLAARPADRATFAVPARTAEMLRADLAAAGIPYRDGSGQVLDFHALRGTYISHLVRSGASVKTCQVLARHSTPSLTIGLYAKASVHDLAGAVGSLPDLTPAPPRSEPDALSATGTNGPHMSGRFSLHLPYGGDGRGRSGAAPGGTEAPDEGPDPGGADRPKSGPQAVLGGPVRPQSDYRCRDLNPDGGSPPEDFKSPASAIPPHRPRAWPFEFPSPGSIWEERQPTRFGAFPLPKLAGLIHPTR